MSIPEDTEALRAHLTSEFYDVGEGRAAIPEKFAKLVQQDPYTAIIPVQALFSDAVHNWHLLGSDEIQNILSVYGQILKSCPEETRDAAINGADTWFSKSATSPLS